jgi:RNA methyltransferase, TrmH family
VSELGFHNELVRAARALHQKKHRQEQRCFLIEGTDVVNAALDAHAKIERVFAAHEAIGAQLATALENAKIDSHYVDRRTIDSLSQTQTAQGVVAVVGFLHHGLSELGDLLPANGPCTVLVLPNLSDPGNAGTLVRTAEAFGARAVCFGAHAVDPYNEKVVRASMGSIFRIPLVSFESWDAFAAQAHSEQLTILGTAADGADVRSVTLPARAAVVVGQERRGLAEIPAHDMEMVVSIPQTPAAHSLNAAIAGAIVLYELERAHGIVGPSTARTSRA